MFKFNLIGKLGDLEIQEMVDDISGKSYVKMTKIINFKPTQQSVVIPFSNVQKLVDLLNDAVLYSKDVGYSETAPSGISTETSCHVKFSASVSTDPDASNDRAFNNHWERRIDKQQVRNEFDVSTGTPFSSAGPEVLRWLSDTGRETYPFEDDLK